MVRILLLGVVAGIVWLMLIPASTAIYTGTEWLPTEPSMWFRQDLVFAALAAAAGLLTGLMIAARTSRPHPVRGLLALVIASGAGTAIAWAAGAFARPVAEAAKAGAQGPLPLTVHAPGFLLTWPLIACATAAIVLILRSLRGR